MITPKIINETKVLFGPVRLSFPSLFTKKKFDGDTGDGKYMVTALIPKDETETVSAIRKAIANAEKAGTGSKWGGKAPKDLQQPLVDGDTYDDEFYEDYYTVRAKTNNRPAVVDRNNAPIVDEEEIYGGVWAYLSVTFFPYNAGGNKGVGAALNSVKKFKDDEPFGQNSAHDLDDFGDDEDDL